MDRSQTPPSSPFNFYGAQDPSMNVPLTSSGSSFSPYLNIDPSYLNQGGSEFIFPTEKRTRGRFELAFSQIGSSVAAGAVYGGVNGLRLGLNETAELAWSKPKYVQLLNLTLKRGAATANTLGVVALFYSAFGVLYSSSLFFDVDDERSTLLAGTSTGLLFKSTAGLKGMARGGGIGLGLAALWCVWQNRDRVKSSLGVNQTL
ncbi:mitochondrial import inner membrane translocase subunit Tim23-like [Branchiostoma lanceolatum]|uniref:TIMM23 protein n=1 Tax=Branchiostoma lanceolatum TaxID=7740 RepID=A0A8J9Z2K8_BRALA|nr:TIMM23 [Branchiostoma lanceolatum]